MLSIIVVIALSQSLDFDDTPHNERTRQFFRTGRVGSASSYNYAFFEFAPITGLGMTSDYTEPNWSQQSQTLTTSPWGVINGGSCSATVVTANADGVAERHQIPSCTAANSYTMNRAGLTVTIAATEIMYISLEAKSYPGAGTQSFYITNGHATTHPVTLCTVTEAAYTTCGVATANSVTNNGTVYIDIGTNTYNASMSGGRGAADVLIKNVMLNRGTSRAPYIATTTAPAWWTPTGAQGEALTFTRSGNATRSKKGLATTGIENGDITIIPPNYPRVEPDADGVLGLRVEGARTNLLVRSQEFDNASWSKVGASVAAPTVTANYAVAPDGNTSAERVQITATTAAAQVSIIRQASSGMSGSYSCTFYVKGNGTSGTTYISNTLAAGGTVPTACPYVSTSWSRCERVFTAAGTADGCDLGNNTYLAMPGGNTQPAHDLLVWQADLQAGTYTTSPIPTTSAAATRNAETPYFAVSGLGAPDPVSVAGSLSAAYGTAAAPTYATIVTLSDAAVSNYFSVYGNTNHNQANSQITQGGAPARTAGTTAGAAWQYARMAASNAATTLDVFHSDRGTTATNSAGSASTWTVGRVYLGILVGQYQPNGIISRVCVDPDPTRCR